MSASDKKRQRKAELTEGMTQKQRQELAEAEKAKRNKTIYTVIGVICAVAAAALLVWNGMSNRNDGNTGAVAATVNGVDYKVPDLQYYYMAAKNNEAYMSQMYAAYGMTSPYDYNTDEGKQWYNEAEGKTYADYFREQALSGLKNTAALVAAANDAGYTLSDAGKKQVEDQLSQIDVVCAKNGLTRSSYFSQVYGHGVTENVFIKNLTNDVLANEYSSHHQENITYDDPALEDYYSEHKDTLDSYDYRVFTISGAPETTLDADGNAVEATDEEKSAAMTAAKEKADLAVAEIKASSDKEQAFIEAAPKYVAESSKGAYASESYSLRKGVMGSQLSTSGAAVATWLQDSTRKANDVAAIEGTQTYYVVLFLNRYRNDEPTVDVRHILVRASTEGSTETDENGNAIPTEEAMNEARTKAQAILDEYLAGDKTEDSFAALANEKSEDTGSNTKGGLYTYVTRGQMVPNFNDWIFDSSRKSGDTGLVENIGSYAGVHVVYFVGQNDPAWKGTALSALQSSAQSEWLTALQDAATAEAKDGMQYVGNASTAEATPAESAQTESDAQPTESAVAETDAQPTESAAG